MQPFKALSTTTKNLKDSRLFNGSVTGCGGVQAEEDEQAGNHSQHMVTD